MELKKLNSPAMLLIRLKSLSCIIYNATIQTNFQSNRTAEQRQKRNEIEQNLLHQT